MTVLIGCTAWFNIISAFGCGILSLFGKRDFVEHVHSRLTPILYEIVFLMFMKLIHAIAEVHYVFAFYICLGKWEDLV